MEHSHTLRWQQGRLVEVDGPEAADVSSPGARLLVADSWLVVDDRVRALDVHRTRFLDSVEAALSPSPRDRLSAGASRSGAEGFWEAAVAAVPRDGAFFPRAELVLAAPGTAETDGPDLAFQVRVRPAPERRRDVVLSTASRDPRTQPLVKGPDLAALEHVRAEARAVGASEAVLLSAGGHVVEGAYSSIVWWRGDTLCVPSDDLPHLPGVTVRTLVTLAAVLGVDVVHDRSTPAELDGFEVWALNALHGIRIATSWVGGPALAEQPGRLASWRARLDALERPVPR